uniref:Nuclear VCP like n=1 Tax=Cynoglossus semilaevis TaxID=244447 RepID=A0A3P8WLB1_CYNSE
MEYGRRSQIAFRIQVEKSKLLNSLASLYRKGNPDSSASSPRREQPAANSPVSVVPTASSAGTAVSTGGWFIDKGPRHEKNNVIDLCDDQPINTMANVRQVTHTGKQQVLKARHWLKMNTFRNVLNLYFCLGIPCLLKISKSKSRELQYPTLKFEDVGGSDDTLTEVCKLLIHMRHPEVYKHLGIVPPRGFLLHGPPGCGKTLLAQAVAGVINPMLVLFRNLSISLSLITFGFFFVFFQTSAPCILFIDEIDAITPKREVASKDMERRMVAQLLTCMDDLNSLTVTAQVLVIGATNRPDSLDPALRRAGRFDREICLGIPDEAARLRIIKTLCRKLKLPEDFDYQQLARLTPGYVGADLMALCREAAMTAVNRALLQVTGEPHNQSSATDQAASDGTDGEVQKKLIVDPGELFHLMRLLKTTETLSETELASLSILMSDFQTSLASIQPSAKREGFATVPDVTWENVGALQDIREELTLAIMAPIRSPEQFKALGLSAPSGVLLAGPPGCGKTLLAKAVANESGLNFISVKGPELLNMYVGESERAVRQVFQRGRNSAPCVIFFDEIDALCPRRSGHESGASVRVVNQLLTEMDGLETRRQVFIMAATNRPDIIDPAILRPGRLDKTLYVGLPPPADRHAILLTITKGGTKPQLEPDVNLEEIACDERCDCFTCVWPPANVICSRMHVVDIVQLFLSFEKNAIENPEPDIHNPNKYIFILFNMIRKLIEEYLNTSILHAYLQFWDTKFAARPL